VCVSELIHPPLVSRLRPRLWVLLDCVIAASFAVAVVGSAGPPLGTSIASQEVGQLLTLLAVVAAAGRRLWPVPALVVAHVTACVLAVLGFGTLGFLPVAYVIYVIPLQVPRRPAITALATVLITTVASITIGPTPSEARAGLMDIRVVTVATVIAASWTIGLGVRQQRAYTAGLREQAERRAQAEVAEERMRIARELHDVVAHGMSLIAVQAGVANHVIAERPEEAARALASIEATSRAALVEMRRLLGVLRGSNGADTGPVLHPAPSLADLDTLVSATSQAGVRVDLEVRGEPRRPLPHGVDLTAYRIVQEALTNVVKHSGAAASRVVLTYEHDAVRIEVTDQGRGSSAPPGDGHGLVGMRERVALYGGEFDAGPLPGRGFRVAARLPLTATP
jgi:signal transduction histidine kinase